MTLTLYAPSAESARSMAQRIRPNAKIAGIEVIETPATQDSLRDFWGTIKHICRPPATKRDQARSIRKRRQ